MKEKKHVIEIGSSINKEDASLVTGGTRFVFELLTTKIDFNHNDDDCQPELCDPVLTCDPASWCAPDSHS